jgi:hypothetical protein
MGARGYQAVQGRFNWEPEGHELLCLYDRLVGPTHTYM